VGVGAIIKEIYIEAPPRVVYEFLTDPAKIARWIGTTAMLDVGPSGIYRIVADGGTMIRGKYLVRWKNCRIVFTSSDEGLRDRRVTSYCVVEINLEPQGEGTSVRLTQREKLINKRRRRILVLGKAAGSGVLRKPGRLEAGP